MGESLYGENTSRIADTWGNWLRAYPWSLFGTLTFARQHGKAAAKAMFRRFHHRLNRWILGVHYHKRHKGLRCFVAVEGVNADDVHIHFLMDGVGPEMALRASVWWWKKAGNAKIVPYDPSLPGTLYCAKQLRDDDDNVYPLGEWNDVACASAQLVG